MLIQIALAIAVISVGLTVLVAFWRMAVGPSLLDRIIALDLLSVGGACLIALWSIYTRSELFLEALLIFALLGFLATTAFVVSRLRHPPNSHIKEGK